MKPTHTPTPWHVNGNDIFSELHTVARMVYSAIPEDEQEANAAFIVRAVNAHDELLAFLNACLDSKGANELLDFVQNNAEELIAKAEAH